MSENPLITIVVPVYKVPYNLLHKCLNSIVTQTSKNFEAILIDDGSPDECGAICDEYAKKYSFMRVIHQDNGGLSVVRNNGIDSAKGDWVCFVDGDDWIEPNTVVFAEQYVKDCGDGDVLIWDEYFEIGGESKKNYFLGKETDKTLCFQNEQCKTLIDYILPAKAQPVKNAFAGIGTANARLYNRFFLVENQLYNKPGLKRMQDNVFNLWVFDRAEKIYYRCERLYHYASNESAATKRYTPDIANTMYFLYESMLEFLDKTGNHSYLPRLYLKFVRILAQCFELNYAHADNKNSLSKRLKMAREDLHRPYFSEVIRNADPAGQSRKTRLVLFLLRHNMYLSMMALTKVNIVTREFRLSHRR